MRPTFDILDYFKFEHLPESLKKISKPFHDLAHSLTEEAWTDYDEVNTALRKLLEAKDCAVRSMLVRGAPISKDEE